MYVYLYLSVFFKRPQHLYMLNNFCIKPLLVPLPLGFPLRFFKIIILLSFFFEAQYAHTTQRGNYYGQSLLCSYPYTGVTRYSRQGVYFWPQHGWSRRVNLCAAQPEFLSLGFSFRAHLPSEVGAS